MTVIHFDKVQALAGFVVGNTESGTSAKVLMRDLLTSDDPRFYTYIEQISEIILSKAKVLINCVYQFLVVLHQNSSADLYVNDFRVDVEIRAKRDIKNGELILSDNITDVRKLQFPQITILKTDKVIYCFKVGWRFGLFFDLARPQDLDIEKMSLSLGELYRYLSFYHVYKSLESDTHINEMIKDGWFPFIELLPGEYKVLNEIYQNKFDFENRVRNVVDSFNKERITKITEKWWKNNVFKEKKALIEAGINAYLQNTQDGFINCGKNLWTEIEGILRKQLFSDTGKSKRVQTPELIKHIIDKEREKSGSDFSLLLPLPFLEYLRDIVFASFDLETGNIDLSRNSSSHGVAHSQQYTKPRALQLILILDQIYFFITG